MKSSPENADGGPHSGSVGDRSTLKFKATEISNSTVDGFEFRFSALEELAYVVDILSKKNLPPSTPNQHWLSRLPGWVKPWSFRQRAVAGLRAALKQFLKLPDDAEAPPDRFEKPPKQNPASRAYMRELAQKEKKNLKINLAQLTRNPLHRRQRRIMRPK